MNLDLWQQRANGGDSRFAIALGLMAIADAIKSGVKEPKILDIIESSTLDDKFDTLIRVIDGMRMEEAQQEQQYEYDEQPKTLKNYFGFLTWLWRRH